MSRTTTTHSIIDGMNVEATIAPGKPLLLLVRMAARGGGVWDGVWDPLAARFSVANFDLSMPDVAALRDDIGAVFREFAAKAVRVATGLGFDAFHILGWTGGTHVALACAIDHPQRVRSCILLCPFYELPDMRPVAKSVEVMHAMMACGDRELYAFYWLMGGLSPEFVARNFDRVAEMARNRAAGDTSLKQDTVRRTAWGRALRRNWASAEVLAGIAVPTLVVATELDRFGFGPNLEMARMLHARLPGAKLEVLSDCGQLVPLEDPDRFLRVANRFYDTLP